MSYLKEFINPTVGGGGGGGGSIEYMVYVWIMDYHSLAEPQPVKLMMTDQR